jgi:hypothetical protein
MGVVQGLALLMRQATGLHYAIKSGLLRVFWFRISCFSIY